MNDFAMQNDRPGWHSMVRELPVAWLGHPHRAVPNRNRLGSAGKSLLINSSIWGFAHPVKMDVQLVSFPLSGVRK